jgi:hypothetical protein
MEQNNTALKNSFEVLAQETYKISQLRKQLETKEKDLMEKLKALANHSSFKSESFNLREISRPGSVDYSAIPVLKDFDVNPYRKADVVYFKLEKIDIESENLLNEILS